MQNVLSPLSPNAHYEFSDRSRPLQRSTSTTTLPPIISKSRSQTTMSHTLSSYRSPTQHYSVEEDRQKRKEESWDSHNPSKVARTDRRRSTSSDAAKVELTRTVPVRRCSTSDPIRGIPSSSSSCSSGNTTPTTKTQETGPAQDRGQSSIKGNLERLTTLIDACRTASIIPTVQSEVISRDGHMDGEQEPGASEGSLDRGARQESSTSLSRSRSLSLRKGLSFKLTVEAEEELPNVTRRLDYKKKRKLGQGASGCVYLSLFKGDQVAVKEIFLEKSDGHYEYKRKKIEEELKAHQSLAHPKIIRYIDSEIYNNQIIIITTYQKRGSIHKYIQKNGPLSEDLAKLVVIQLLEGLSYMHSQGVIHRDIKTANLLIEDDINIKIADFGVSSHTHSSTDAVCFNSRQLNGSLHWMAPELFLDDQYDPRVDTWSLGCTIIEMLTGKVPFVETYPDMYCLYMRSDDKTKFDIPKTYNTCENKKIKLSEELLEFMNQIMLFDWQKRPSCSELYTEQHRYPWLTT